MTMNNYLPEFSHKIFEYPTELELYQVTMDNYPQNWFENRISKREFDKKYLPKIDTPEFAYKYCKKYKVKNNSKMEKLIAKDPKISYFYASFILEGKFELGEAVIKKDNFFSILYADNVLKGRFELGEPVILKDRWVKQQYIELLNSKNIPIPQEFRE